MATYRPRSTQAQREQAAEWREAGKSIPWIAARLGFSIGAVNWWMLQLGADRPGRHFARPRPNTAAVQRGNHVFRAFTAAEDAALQAFALEGLSHTAIAHRLTQRDPTRPRRPNSVKGRLMTIARHQERASQEAAD